MRYKYIGILIILLLLLPACHKISKKTDKIGVYDIEKRNEPIDLRIYESLPSFNYKNDAAFQVDLRFSDLNMLDLTEYYYDLIHADFDNLTVWPNALPEDFNPNHILEFGKNKGPYIEHLHEKDINGEGVNIAFIDLPLSTTHVEYADKLASYVYLGDKKSKPTMHGNAVASIIIGDNIGIAPNVNLHYWGIDIETERQYGDVVIDVIDEILAYNRDVDQQDRIIAVGISKGFQYEDVSKKILEAEKEGLFVITTVQITEFDYQVMGLGRHPTSDPEKITSYIPGWFSSKGVYQSADDIITQVVEDDDTITNRFSVPMDSRTLAGPKNDKNYVFYRFGGLSWVVPYLTGAYALNYQVNPEITPREFLENAFETSDTIHCYYQENLVYRLKILNLEKLLDIK